MIPSELLGQLGPFARKLLDFAGGATSDLDRQVRQRDPFLSMTPLGVPDPGAAITAGLERAGVPGHQEMGGSLGPIDVGPREALGFGLGMMTPGGPAGKGGRAASALEQMAIRDASRGVGPLGRLAGQVPPAAAAKMPASGYTTNFRGLSRLKGEIADVQQRLQDITAGGNDAMRLPDEQSVVADGMVTDPNTGASVDPTSVLKGLQGNLSDLYSQLQAAGRQYAAERIRQLNPELFSQQTNGIADPAHHSMLPQVLAERHYQTGMADDLKKAARQLFGGQDSNQAFDVAQPNPDYKLTLPGGAEFPASGFFGKGGRPLRYNDLSDDARAFVDAHLGNMAAEHPEFFDTRLGADEFGAAINRVRGGRRDYILNQIREGNGQVGYKTRDAQGNPVPREMRGRAIPPERVFDETGAVRPEAQDFIERLTDAFLEVPANAKRFLNPDAIDRDMLREGMGQTYRSKTNTQFPRSANQTEAPRDAQEALRNDIIAHERDKAAGPDNFSGELGRKDFRTVDEALGDADEVVDRRPAVTDEDSLVPGANFDPDPISPLPPKVQQLLDLVLNRQSFLTGAREARFDEAQRLRNWVEAAQQRLIDDGIEPSQF